MQVIVRSPLQPWQVSVPDETISRIHFLTAGHPEVVQQLAELVLQRAMERKRPVLTPADADEAAKELAGLSDDLFVQTWSPHIS
jgi:hypothetical protein